MGGARTAEETALSLTWPQAAAWLVLLSGFALTAGFVLGRDSKGPPPKPRVEYRMLPMPGPDQAATDPGGALVPVPPRAPAAREVQAITESKTRNQF